MPLDARSLPWSEDAEKAVLGGILIDPDNTLPAVTTILRSRDFYLDAHRLIFNAILEMSACGIRIDMVTLRDCMHQNGDEERVGGPLFIVHLTDGIMATTNVSYYAEIVRQKARERRMLAALQNAQTAYLNNTGGIDPAVRDLKAALQELEIPSIQQETERWHTVSTDNAEDWEGIQPVEWACEEIIPRNSLGWIGGGPKDGKSVLALDMMIHMAHAQFEPLGSVKFLDKFVVHGQKVFYVSKEDGIERLFQRWPDINQSYGYSDPPPGLIIVPRKYSSFMLTEPSHVGWLQDQLQQTESNFLCLDVFSELIPGIDEMKEIRQSLTILKDLRDRMNITVAVIDHTRKTSVQNVKYRSSNQDLDPSEIRGAFKFGASDWTIMLGTDAESPNKIRLAIKCKDSREADQSFVVSRSPFGSRTPKHTIEATIAELAIRSRAHGQENKEIVRNAVTRSMSAEEIAPIVEMSVRTVQRHLMALVRERQLQSSGHGRNLRYEPIPNYEQEELYEEN